MEVPTPSPTPAQTQRLPGPADAPPVIDDARAAKIVARLPPHQNIGGALAGGTLGAILGAVLWALITVATQFEIGWEAIGVGFLVGFGARSLGKGIDPVYGYIGAALSFLGIAFGNILTGMIVVCNVQHIAFLDLASRLNAGMAWALLTAGFTPIDVIF